MSIELVTGLPGHGKTLYTVAKYRDIAVKDKRPVYYSGIKDLALPWTEFDPEKWEDLPPGAIFIIDECQFKMPVRGRGTPPAWIERLAVHRHAGIDFVLITQDPMLLDSFVRRLCDRHWHVVRKFGTKFATVHEFPNGVKDQVSKARTGSITHEWRYPKDVFDLYKSAEVHTVKSRIPMRVWVLVAIPFIVGALVWFSYDRLRPSAVSERVSGVPAAKAASGPGAFNPPGFVPAGAPGRGFGSAGAPGSAADVEAYLVAQKPRIEGLAYTAPIYDEVTRPSTAPFPSACLSSKTRCKCYSQQATVLAVPDGLCREIAGGGYFVAFNSAGERQGAMAEGRRGNQYARADDNAAPASAFGFGSTGRPDSTARAVGDGVQAGPPSEGGRGRPPARR